MSEVIWTAKAIEDVNDIFDYIANDSVLYADKMVEAIIARTVILRSQSHSGRRVPEDESGMFWEVFEGQYRIIYSLNGLSAIEIIRVIHFARRLKL